MSGTNTPNCDTPSIFSLAVRSKKALLYGKQLCQKAQELSRASTQVAAELLALNAKVLWIAQGMGEQLKIVSGVAKNLEIQRLELVNRAKQWDRSRAYYSNNLDKMLEQLESQVVPPDFHQTPTSDDATSPFGSQHWEGEAVNGGTNGVQRRGKWKTLRDFVYERAIVEAIETIDRDRNDLDDILAVTEDYPQLLKESILSFRNSLPVATSLPQVQEMFVSQERVTEDMGKQLESMTKHYGQMEDAVREREAGVILGEEDLAVLNRDVEELPSIIADLEGGVKGIQANYDALSETRNIWRGHLHDYQLAVDKLDGIGEAMTGMVEQQASMAIEFEEQIVPLQEHLDSLEKLCITYKSYQTSYNKLVLEMERRRHYRSSSAELIQKMLRQLAELREEESQKRREFFDEHGEVLPKDLCTCIENEPTRWKIVPESIGGLEELPEIDGELLAQAKKFLETMR